MTFILQRYLLQTIQSRRKSGEDAMQKLKMHSPDMTQDHIARIRELFPNCVTEARNADGSLRLSVDFDALRQ